MVRGGVLADRQLSADLPVAEPARDERENLRLARRQPGRQAGCRRRSAERLDPREQRRHADVPGERRGLAEQCSRAFAVACEQEASVLVGGVREPRRGAHPPVECERLLEVLFRALRLAERRSEHPEIAIGSAVTRDEMADHHVRAGERLELRIDEGRRRLVAERCGRVREVRE